MFLGIVHNICDKIVAKFVKLWYNMKEYDWYIIPIRNLLRKRSYNDREQD